MVGKLKEELVTLATGILAAREDKDLTTLYHSAKTLYEKLAVLKFIDEKLSDIEVDVSKNDIASHFEKIATAVLSGNTSVPESNPHEEDLMTPGMDTINDMVSEMPSESDWDEVLMGCGTQPDVMETLVPIEKNEKAAQIGQIALNDASGKQLYIDLDDRLDFVKHLFNHTMEDYNRVISQLNTIDTEERSIAFIKNMIKPEYDHWKGKEDYEARFIAVIKRRFSS